MWLVLVKTNSFKGEDPLYKAYWYDNVIEAKEKAKEEKTTVMYKTYEMKIVL